MNPLQEGTYARVPEGSERRILQSLGIVVFCADPRTHRFSYVNDRARSLLGVDPQQWLDDPSLFERALHPDDRRRIRALFEQVAADGHPRSDRLRWGSGADPRLLELTLEREGESGPGELLVGTLADRTEPLRTVEELREARARSKQRFEEMVNALDGIVWEARLPGFEFTFVSRQAERILGYPVERWMNETDFWAANIHPDDREEALRSCEEQSRKGLPYEFEYRMRAADGRTVWIRDLVTVSGTPHGRVLCGMMIDTTASKQIQLERDRLFAAEQRLRAEAEDAERRESFLSNASRVLAETLDYDAALQEVARLALPDFADWCAVDMAGPDGAFRRVAAAHSDPAKADLVRRVLEEFPPPVRVKDLPDNIHTETAFLKERMPEEDLDRMATSPEHARVLKQLQLCSIIGAQLTARGRLLGEIRFCYARSSRRHYTRRDLPMLVELARRAATAIDNARLYREAQDAEARAQFLSEASRLLSSTLDYDTALDQILHLALPTLADWCSLDLFEIGAQRRRVTAAHANPERAAQLQALQRFPPPRWPPAHLAAFDRGGGVYLAETLPEEVLRSISTGPEHFRLLRELGTRSAMVAVLAARGRMLGLIRLAFGESGRRYTVKEVPVVQELALRAAMALDNARLYREAQEAVRARDEFLSVASHELRTPCTSLQLGVQSLLRLGQRGRLAQASPTLLRSILETSERQSRRLGTLVDKLLDVSRIGAGRLELDLEPVDLAAVAREAAAGFREDLAASGSPLELAAESPLVGRWDRSRLAQVVTNLLSNAIKYGDGKPISLRVAREGERARLAVTDHGIGIPPERQPQLFQRFERAVSSRHYGGLGLGLYIVRQIVEALGGTISFESEPGVQTRFEVDLPLQGPAAAPAPSSA